MRPPDPVERVALQTVGRELARKLPRGVGFALFLRTHDRVDYMGNAAREDVQAELRRWLDKMAARPVSAQRTVHNAEYEQLCVELATELTEEPGVAVALFIFDVGREPESGSFAWKITGDGFVPAIEEFCKP